MSPSPGRPKTGSLPLGGAGAKHRWGLWSPSPGRPKTGSLPLGGAGAKYRWGLQ